MKRTSIVICCVILSLCLIAAFGGCVTKHINSGTMSQLVGTYKLTTYTVTPDSTPETADLTYIQRTQNFLIDKGVEAYLVVTGELVGYYFYKDNQTDWRADTVTLTYKYNPDENNKPTELICGLYVNNEAYDKSYTPGYGREDCGFNVKAHTLNYKQHSFSGKYVQIKDTTSVVYTKVNKDTTTAYVENTIGKKLPIIRYEIKKFTGLLNYNVSVPTRPDLAEIFNPFIYCFVEFDNFSYTAKVYYALKADYAAGKRDDQLKQMQTCQVEVTEDQYRIYLNFNFADADNNAVFSSAKGIISTSFDGEFRYKYDPTTNSYVIAEDGNGDARDILTVYGSTEQLENYVATAIYNYAQNQTQAE